MLQVKFAVEIGRELGAGDADLEVMPLASRGRRIANPFDRRPLAVLEFPQHQIVFERICADGEVVAVRFEVEQDSGALIDPAGNPLEAHGDLAVAKIRHILGHHIGEIGISLNAVEEFGITVAVKRARFVGDAGRGLALLPLAPVDHQHLIVALALDAPDADDTHDSVQTGMAPEGDGGRSRSLV
jgi:hypothetical protein